MSVAHEAYGQHTGPWTVEDVLRLPEDVHQRIELVGGSLMMSPSPGVPHQRASRRLATVLEDAAEDVAAPVEILEAVNVVVPDGLLIPDIAVVDEEAAVAATLTINPHDVLVAVEIASPSTRVQDRTLKAALYAAAGVAHYWRVELVPIPRLYLGTLEGGHYTDRVIAAGTPAHIDRPFPVDIDPGSLVTKRP